MSVEDDLRNAIRASGLSAYEIARRAEAKGEKIDHKAISRYLNHAKGINSCTFAVIADVLDLCLVKQGDPAPCKPPPDFDEELLQTAAEMAYELHREMSSVRLDHILDLMRSKRRKIP